ncbi:hypothetical protein ABZP36_023149 [Zizania latifolia]
MAAPTALGHVRPRPIVPLPKALTVGRPPANYGMKLKWRRSMEVALIQYTDAATALEAKNSLDGSSILSITFSAHKDLNIKFQSHRSRDYTNPYLPVNPTAIEGIAHPAVNLYVLNAPSKLANIADTG